MRRVLLIVNQTSLPGERGFTRYLSLYYMLKETRHDVRIVTSIFNHYDKQIRDRANFYKDNPDFNITFIDEPGYTKNVSPKRIISQCIFAKNLGKWFKQYANEYDVVFMTMPTNEGAMVVGNYCNKHRIPYIVNIEDLWPEAMSLFIKPKILFKICTAPMKWIANKAYSQANALVAVSHEYLERAKRVNSKASQEAVIYLGAMIEKFDEGARKYRNHFCKPKNEFWIAYIGTLGVSYDINTFIDAVHLLHQRGYKNIRAKILGRGPNETEFKNHAKTVGADVDFVGFMLYDEMAGYLVNCDAMINAIKKNAAQSIVNKVSDYFASGKPTLNGCAHPEMRNLISNYHAGLNYCAENAESLASAILQLYENPLLCRELGENGRKLAEELFDRKTSYQRFIQMIDTVEAN